MDRIQATILFVFNVQYVQMSNMLWVVLFFYLPVNQSSYSRVSLSERFPVSRSVRFRRFLPLCSAEFLQRWDIVKPIVSAGKLLPVSGQGGGGGLSNDRIVGQVVFLSSAYDSF